MNNSNLCIDSISYSSELPSPELPSPELPSPELPSPELPEVDTLEKASQNSFQSTVENENGDKLVLGSYSIKSENHIIVNNIDMTFEEFRGYLSSVGMIDEHEFYAAKHLEELKRVSMITSLVTGILMITFAIWASTLAQSIMRIQ